MFIFKIFILKLLLLIFFWELVMVYINLLSGEIEWIYVFFYIVIGVNLLLMVIFVLSLIKIFKYKEKV